MLYHVGMYEIFLHKDKANYGTLPVATRDG